MTSEQPMPPGWMWWLPPEQQQANWEEYLRTGILPPPLPGMPPLPWPPGYQQKPAPAPAPAVTPTTTEPQPKTTQVLGREESVRTSWER